MHSYHREKERGAHELRLDARSAAAFPSVTGELASVTKVDLNHLTTTYGHKLRQISLGMHYMTLSSSEDAAADKGKKRN